MFVFLPRTLGQYFILMKRIFENVIENSADRPEVTLSGWQDVRIQELVNSCFSGCDIVDTWLQELAGFRWH